MVTFGWAHFGQSMQPPDGQSNCFCHLALSLGCYNRSHSEEKVNALVIHVNLNMKLKDEQMMNGKSNSLIPEMERDGLVP